MTAPCLVIGTPRSRTAWLSACLSTPGRVFRHEPAVEWTAPSDLHAFFADDRAAACDSSLSLFWREIMTQRPDTRLVVVLRPVEQVMASFIKLGVPVSVATWDLVRRVHAEASEASQRGRTFLASFDDLSSNLVCSNLYRHVHGVVPPVGWISHWQAMNVQRDWRKQFAAIGRNAAGVAAVFGNRLAGA